MLDRDYVVCALAAAVKAVPGSIFDRTCCVCGQRLQIAPSGQRVLKELPDAVPICGPCFMARVEADDPVVMAASDDEMRREVQSKQPNPWRRRN